MLRRASTLLMVVAVILVVGFIYWLNWKADTFEAEVAPVLEEEVATEVADLDPAALAADPGSAVGQTAWLRSVTVDQRLGRGAFSVRLDSASTFPILLSADQIQMDQQVYGEDVVTLYGHVFTLNDSIAAEWVDQGAVDQENASTIPAMPSFMLADSVSFN